MRRLAVLLLIALLGLAVTSVAPAIAQSGPSATPAQDSDVTGDEGEGGDDATTSQDAADVDCDDFATQEEAQDFLEANPDDARAALDPDDNGVACDESFPAGGVDTGAGGTALTGAQGGGGGSAAGAGLALVALLAASGGLILLTRRAQPR